ncbi:MAG TPA: energy transducer TonB [Terriglobales bacterium]|nr:energy transducer TonB [Terriglobales bacterium]
MNVRLSIAGRAVKSDLIARLGLPGKVFGAVGLAVCFAWCGLAWGSPSAWRVSALRRPSGEMERQLSRVPAHISEFNPVSEPLALPRCGDVRPPEALLTPDPLLPSADDDAPVRVSFIVGSDGHVHSAFVLNGAGPDEDEAVLRAVRQWRYRPALCNGVPTDSEARVRFIIH